MANVRSYKNIRLEEEMRLTPIGKLTLMVVGLVLTGFVGAAGAAATRPHEQEWSCVAVEPGDTLWGLSAGTGDVRAAMHRIADQNGLRSPVLQPGQALWVPAGTPAAERAIDSAACSSG